MELLLGIYLGGFIYALATETENRLKLALLWPVWVPLSLLE